MHVRCHQYMAVPWVEASINACQGRSTKIKSGQAIDDVMQTRGVWGHASQGKVLKSRCSVSIFGAILGPSTLQ